MQIPSYYRALFLSYHKSESNFSLSSWLVSITFAWFSKGPLNSRCPNLRVFYVTVIQTGQVVVVDEFNLSPIR
jgi:hypothetical protein